MVGDLGIHGTDDGDVIDVLGGTLEEFADREAGFTVVSEAEWGGKASAGAAFCEEVVGDGAVLEAAQCGFGVEGIDVGGPAIQEEVNDAFGPTGEVGLAGCEAGWSSGWSAGGVSGAESSVGCQKMCQPESSEAESGLGEQRATVEWMSGVGSRWGGIHLQGSPVKVV
jgi:hypothetical protein